jgi:hypothetical protein
LHPTILVRNTTNKRTAFSIVLDWHGPSGRGQATLPVVQLAPFATEQLPIGAMQKQLGIPDDAHWALVSLTTNAAPDDLIAVASSRDATGGHGVEAQFIGGTSGHLAGGEWPADANHNTIAALTNIGSKPAEALLTLHYDGGKQKFELQRTIAPGDQMWVNLAQLIRQRIPDRTGSALPVDVSTVTYDLRDLTQGGHGLIASALGVNSTYGFQASPEVAKCCFNESPGWSPDVFDLLIGVTDPAAIYATDACNGDSVDITGDFLDWWSGNSAVATVASRQVHGVAAGSTYAYASGYMYVWNGTGCTEEPVQVQAPVSVQAPTILSVSPAQGLVGTPIGVTITGTNFASGATVSAGSNITVSSVSVSSTTQITATFTPTNSSSAGGNQAVTVKVGTSPASNSKNFYNQVPTHFQRFNQPPEAPGGLGPVITLVNGTAYNLSGTAVALNVCGVYENFIFDIADQQSTQITNGTVKVTEIFSKISSLPGPTPATNIPINLESQGMQDIQIYGFTYPTCPATNQNQNLDMTWTVLVGSTVYPATTVVHITKGNFNGTLNVTSNITTP